MIRLARRQEPVIEANLSQLLEGCEAAPGLDREVAVSGIAYRSDAVRAGDAFFCIPGFKADGHSFAEDAVARGAAALVCARPLAIAVPQCVVPDTRRALALASARFYGEPSRSMDVVGITGDETARRPPRISWTASCGWPAARPGSWGPWRRA